MDVALMAIAEQLWGEFDDLSGSTVARVLMDCRDEYANVDPGFIEQAARARLAAIQEDR